MYWFFGIIAVLGVLIFWARRKYEYDVHVRDYGYPPGGHSPYHRAPEPFGIGMHRRPGGALPAPYHAPKPAQSPYPKLRKATHLTQVHSNPDLYRGPTRRSTAEMKIVGGRARALVKV